MLIIQQSASTTLVVTVTELTTIPAPNYLFEFIHEQSLLSYFCILTNVSQATSRFDEFVLIGNVDVAFKYKGAYIYNIYQQTSAVNLDPLLSQGLVETGRAEVVGASTITQTFYDTTIINEIYEQ